MFDRSIGGTSDFDFKTRVKTNWYYSSAAFSKEPSDDIHQKIINNGDVNISQPVSRRSDFLIFRYSKLVDSSWPHTLSVFILILFISWSLFAIVYWIICYAHGDFDPDHLPEVQGKNKFKPCIYDIRNFASCFLFSMEAQHTVGYGIKAPTDECAEAIFVNTIHCIIGFIMQGFMAAVIFSKMTKPRLRSQTIMFSKKAVICLRNGKLCLMFRIGDIRTRHIWEAKVRAFLVRSTKTMENEKLICTQDELQVKSDGCEQSMFFNWPIVIYHVIVEGSPLYYLSPSDLNKQKFEIMVIIEGTDENTGQVTQARNSYLPKEIQWGKRFVSMFSYDDLRHEYEVDFSLFDTVMAVSTPLCCAAYIKEYAKMQESSLKLDFTPRQSIGEIHSSTLIKLKERLHFKMVDNIPQESIGDVPTGTLLHLDEKSHKNFYSQRSLMIDRSINADSLKSMNVSTSSTCRLDFTPRHSVGEIPKNTLLKLKERLQTRISMPNTPRQSITEVPLIQLNGNIQTDSLDESDA